MSGIHHFELEGFEPTGHAEVFGTEFTAYTNARGTRMLVPEESQELLAANPELAQTLGRIAGTVDALDRFAAFPAEVLVPETPKIKSLKTATVDEEWHRVDRHSVYSGYDDSVIIKSADLPESPTDTITEFAVMSGLRHALTKASQKGQNLPKTPAQLALIQSPDSKHQTIVMEQCPGTELGQVRRRPGAASVSPRDIARSVMDSAGRELRPFLNNINGANILVELDESGAPTSESVKQLTLIDQPNPRRKTRLLGKLAGVTRLQKLLGN